MVLQLHKKRALVTGGAGLIGSHIVDLLIHEGWRVRILDNLEPQTHRNGKPGWINPNAEFANLDIRDRTGVTAALQGIDVIFHEADTPPFVYEQIHDMGTDQ